MAKTQDSTTKILKNLKFFVRPHNSLPRTQNTPPNPNPTPLSKILRKKSTSKKPPQNPTVGQVLNKGFIISPPSPRILLLTPRLPGVAQNHHRSQSGMLAPTRPCMSLLDLTRPDPKYRKKRFSSEPTKVC